MNEATDIKPERVARLLSFCLASLDEPDAITEQQFQELYDFGISQIEVLEALYSVAHSNGSVFLAKALNVEIEPQIKRYLADHGLSIGFQ
ncbi:MAG: hypothetical protein V3T17_17720 [Pseudomonadales bacterium]